MNTYLCLSCTFWDVLFLFFSTSFIWAFSVPTVLYAPSSFSLVRLCLERELWFVNFKSLQNSDCTIRPYLYYIGFCLHLFINRIALNSLPVPAAVLRLSMFSDTVQWVSAVNYEALLFCSLAVRSPRPFHTSSYTDVCTTYILLLAEVCFYSLTFGACLLILLYILSVKLWFCYPHCFVWVYGKS